MAGFGKIFLFLELFRDGFDCLHLEGDCGIKFRLKLLQTQEQNPVMEILEVKRTVGEVAARIEKIREWL